MIAYDVSKHIFDIKSNEYNTNVSTSIFSESGKNVLSFRFIAARALSKSSGGGFTAYSSTSVSGGFKFGSSTGGSEFDTFPKINTVYVSGE